jgi:hypothetical protein
MTMTRGLQRRISQAESRLPAVLERQRKRREQLKLNYSTLAFIHATAVAAIVLYGNPKIDESLIRAWVRALDYYKRNRHAAKVFPGLDRLMASGKSSWTFDELTQADPSDQTGHSDRENEADRASKLANKPLAEAFKDYVDATDRMHSLIMDGAVDQAARFTEIFKSGPVWLLNFTSTFLDAKVLKFDLPDLSGPAEWGKLGRRDARRWPMLPVGMMTDGDPIPAQETDVSADLSIEELLFALDATNRPPWEWTRRERFVIESLSERNIDETLRAKIESYKRMDELYSKIHQVKKTTDT